MPLSFQLHPFVAILLPIVDREKKKVQICIEVLHGSIYFTWRSISETKSDLIKKILKQSGIDLG